MTLRIALGLALLGLTLARAGAADYYVSPTGNNANPGSEAQPWQTLTFAAGQLAPDDTLYARGGIYPERLLLSAKNGTTTQRILIRNYEGETPVIDGNGITVPAGGRQGLVAFTNCSYLTFEGFEVTNFVTTASGRIPAGIQVEGSGTGLRLAGNKVHHIWQSSTNSNANGFGIAVYGTAATPIDGLVLDGNEVYDLRTGQSESVVLNGNVVNFTVSDNVVHDCNNIGIDFIGYEGSAPDGFDRARDGRCVGNIVYNIDSATNPGYGGDFVTGGGDRSAAGIYIDGGSNIVVERNLCYQCNYGIELASEDASGFTESIVLRNNLLHHNHLAGLIMGGYDANRGTTRYCQILNNVFFENDTTKDYSGQVAIQFYFEDNVFKNNIVWARPDTLQMVIYFGAGRVANGRLDVGLHEFMTAWQAWRDTYFELPDGGGDADPDDDSDRDTAGNLMEFSQGMDPTVSDAALLPGANREGYVMRYHYRKAQPGQVYEVEISATLPGPVDWPAAAVPEETDGGGAYWRDFPLTEGRIFVRLRVMLPAV